VDCSGVGDSNFVTNGNTISRTYGYPHRVGNGYPYANVHRNCDPHRYINTYGIADGLTYAYSNPHCYGNGIANGHVDSYVISNSNRDIDSDFLEDSDGIADAFRIADSYAHRDCNKHAEYDS